MRTLDFGVPKTVPLLVVGDDWSSRMPYYAQRRAFCLPDWDNAFFPVHTEALYEATMAYVQDHARHLILVYNEKNTTNVPQWHNRVMQEVRLLFAESRVLFAQDGMYVIELTNSP